MEYHDAEAHEQARAMGMAVYYVYLLKKGPTWSPDSTPEIDALQEAHLANMRRLREEGKLVLNGPLLDSFQLSGEIRGIGVLKAASMTEAQAWIGTDPMVRSAGWCSSFTLGWWRRGFCLEQQVDPASLPPRPLLGASPPRRIAVAPP
jgi:uncharacterized protein YciI